MMNAFRANVLFNNGDSPHAYRPGIVTVTLGLIKNKRSFPECGTCGGSPGYYAHDSDLRSVATA